MFWNKRRNPTVRSSFCLVDFPVGVLRHFLLPLLEVREVAKLDTALLNRSLRTLLHEALVGVDVFTPVGVQQFVWFADRQCSSNHLHLTHGSSAPIDEKLLRYLTTTSMITVGRGSISLDVLSAMLSYCKILKSIVLTEGTMYRQRWNVPATLQLISIEVGNNVSVPCDCLLSLMTSKIHTLKLSQQQPAISILRKVAGVCKDVRKLSAFYQSVRGEPPTNMPYEEAMRQVLRNCAQLTNLQASVSTAEGYFGVGGSCLLHVKLHGQVGGLGDSQDTAIMNLVQASPRIQTLELYAFYGNTNVTLFAIAENLSDLRSLVITNIPFATDEGLSAIRISCPNLTSIQLRMCEAIENAGLIEGPSGMLQHLSLSTSVLTHSTLIACVRHDNNLRTLNLEGLVDLAWTILPTTLIEVVHYLPHLVEFVFDDHAGNSCLVDDFMSALVLCCPLLQVLRIPNSRNITSVGQQQVSNLRHLRELSLLGCCDLTSDALCAIAKGCPALESISISSASNRGICHLAKYCRRLQYISIWNCKWVRDYALLKLIASARDLHTLYIHNSYLLSYRLKQRLITIRRRNW